MRPMLVQYLVGICCLRANSAAVDVTLGDMVLDPAAGKERDVDVTVTIEEGSTVTHAFKAYEVKREGKPLDVASVEQLCIKLNDMPSITHRAIVSTSGFTAAAQAKAHHHGIELYELQPWKGNLEDSFPNWEMIGPARQVLQSGRRLLVWSEWKLYVIASTAQGAFNIQATDPVLTAESASHPAYQRFTDLEKALLLRSTELLYNQEPAETVARIFPMQPGPHDISVSPAWPHTHTLDVAGEGAHLKIGTDIALIDRVTISGRLQWQSDKQSEYYIMRRVPEGTVFAGAIIMLGAREGQLFGFVLSPTSQTANIHIVQLEEKHLNIIRRLKIDRLSSDADD